MSRDEPLVYAGELVDDGDDIVAVYGSVFAVWLVGIVQQLLVDEKWAATSDGVAAIQQCNDLIIRLMGGGVYPTQKTSSLPFYLHAFGMAPVSPEIGMFNVQSWGGLTSGVLASSNINVERDCFTFDVFLEAGDYRCFTCAGKAPGRGKIQLNATGAATKTGSVFDLYAAVWDGTYLFEETFTVAVAGVVTITYRRHLKNPLASQNNILLSFAVIRKQ